MNMPPPVALQDRPTIPLIEDDPTRHGLLTEALEKEGFGVARPAMCPTRYGRHAPASPT